MKRTLLLISLLPVLASLLFAQAGAGGSRVDQLQSTIKAELESHGDRVVGKEAMRWKTRVENFSGCRAQITVQVNSNWGESTVRTESVNLLLGALEPHSVELQKSWLELLCAGQEKCVFSTSTCSQKTKAGMITDCATASQKRAASFSLQLDGDAAASTRLQQAFREAINLCRQPKVVSF
jgi:hypothetical protein